VFALSLGALYGFAGIAFTRLTNGLDGKRRSELERLCLSKALFDESAYAH
jgi:hypothetical protein